MASRNIQRPYALVQAPVPLYRHWARAPSAAPNLHPKLALDSPALTTVVSATACSQNQQPNSSVASPPIWAAIDVNPPAPCTVHRPNHPSPARGDIIKPGVSTPGKHASRRNHPSPARGDIIKPGVSTPGMMRSDANHPSPARGDIIKPGVSTPGRMRSDETIRAPQGATS